MATAPLMIKLDAVLVLDGEGNRLAGKYYGSFLKKAGTEDGKVNSIDDVRKGFESQLHAKINGISARADSAEVVTVMGRTCVFCGGATPTANPGDVVRVIHVGPPGESELVLAHLVEGVYDALSNLMGSQVDRAMVLDNLELVFLLIDEHCDGGVILETNGRKLAAAVLLRDDDPAMEAKAAAAAAGKQGQPQAQGVPAGVSVGDMTIGQALRQARAQFISNLTSRDGM